jgi:hypothetical protein
MGLHNAQIIERMLGVDNHKIVASFSIQLRDIRVARKNETP